MVARIVARVVMAKGADLGRVDLIDAMADRAGSSVRNAAGRIGVVGEVGVGVGVGAIADRVPARNRAGTMVGSVVDIREDSRAVSRARAISANSGDRARRVPAGQVVLVGRVDRVQDLVVRRSRLGRVREGVVVDSRAWLARSGLRRFARRSSLVVRAAVEEVVRERASRHEIRVMLRVPAKLAALAVRPTEPTLRRSPSLPPPTTPPPVGLGEGGKRKAHTRARRTAHRSTVVRRVTGLVVGVAVADGAVIAIAMARVLAVSRVAAMVAARRLVIALRCTAPAAARLVRM